MVQLDELVAQAKALDILQRIRANDVHCPNCHSRLALQGECVVCGIVGSSEDDLRRMDAARASALLERSIARRRSWKPETRAKSQER